MYRGLVVITLKMNKCEHFVNILTFLHFEYMNEYMNKRIYRRRQQKILFDVLKISGPYIKCREKLVVLILNHHCRLLASRITD